jgi:hypothetical protein
MGLTQPPSHHVTITWPATGMEVVAGCRCRCTASAHVAFTYVAASDDSGALRLIERGRLDAARSKGCRAVARHALFRTRIYARLLNLDNHLNFHRLLDGSACNSHGGACVLADLLSEYFHH